MKRKKKGRPSLLDLQKRSLRLQNKNPNPNPNSNSKRNPNPNSKPSTGRRITRRNPNPDDHASDDEEEEEGEENSAGKRRRREKKLKLVHRIPNSADSASGSDKEEKNNSSKATDAQEEEPTTPLPDKKLLVFILDRLQKKDTYGVFSEPVDAEELPDYHEIIEHPMDFRTVRKKLASGAYASLEQFEKDVFLISSNAMCYNAQDTIYYRQARAIHELAKKNFENLRQESDDNETKPKTIVRRGRPPTKNIKLAVASLSVDRATSDFSSDATLANAGEGSNLTNDLSRKVSASGRACAGDISTRTTYNLCNTEQYNWLSMRKSETNEDFPGIALISAKHGKKLPVADENRRNTFYQPQPSTSRCESSILTTFDRERKHLMPQIGLKLEHAYARSLARFAAKLGPIGWAIAAKKIERVLPQGTRYGRGWIGANEAPNHFQPSISSLPQVSSQSKIPMGTTTPQSNKLPQRPEPFSTDLANEERHLTTPPASEFRSPTSMGVAGEPVGGSTHGGGSNPLSSICDGNNSIQFNSPSELHQNVGMSTSGNGHTSPFGSNLPSHVWNMGRSVQPSGPFCSEEHMTHARALDMVSSSSFNNNTNSIHQLPEKHLEAESGNLVSNLGATNSSKILPHQDHGQDSQGSWRSLPQPKKDAVPPDLNVRFQSPISSAPGSMVDSQLTELGLQL